MERYEIYRAINLNGRYADSLVCVAFNEDIARDIVESFRKKTGNQTWSYKKVE